MSQTGCAVRSTVVEASGNVVEEIATCEPVFDFDACFQADYPRIARVIARVIRDRSRAEELAVDVFCKLWARPEAHGDHAGSWLYRAAVRAGLDELRRRLRRGRYESLLGRLTGAKTPEQLHAAQEESDQVRAVLARMKRRDAELLTLRSEGLSYSELALTLGLKPASVGTLLVRAQQAFRKGYVDLYGEPGHER